jgi:hypothetical protein
LENRTYIIIHIHDMSRLSSTVNHVSCGLALLSAVIELLNRSLTDVAASFNKT